MTDRTDVREDAGEEVQGALPDPLLLVRGLFGGSALHEGIKEEWQRRDASWLSRRVGHRRGTCPTL